MHGVVFCCDAHVQALAEIMMKGRTIREREDFHQRSLSQLSTVRQSHTTNIEESLDRLRQCLDVAVTGEDMSRFYESDSMQRSEKWGSIDREQTLLMQESGDRLQQLQLVETSLAILHRILENGDQEQAFMMLEGFMDTINSLNTELTAAERKRAVLEQSVMHAVTTENEQMLTMMSLLTRDKRSPTVIACC